MLILSFFKYDFFIKLVKSISNKIKNQDQSELF